MKRGRWLILDGKKTLVSQLFGLDCPWLGYPTSPLPKVGLVPATSFSLRTPTGPPYGGRLALRCLCSPLRFMIFRPLLPPQLAPFPPTNHFGHSLPLSAFFLFVHQLNTTQHNTTTPTICRRPYLTLPYLTLPYLTSLGTFTNTSICQRRHFRHTNKLRLPLSLTRRTGSFLPLPLPQESSPWRHPHHINTHQHHRCSYEYRIIKCNQFCRAIKQHFKQYAPARELLTIFYLQDPAIHRTSP